ncbi:non-ribosomal peptide synthetase [Paenibacillus glucanolyticus]|uniref:non-ribosomal peptide synthetase n=1 Tax=Paenibacillus glucanolyticus TaxID=59843 RepID=UPI003CFCF388
MSNDQIIGMMEPKDKSRNYPKEKTVHALFEEQVERTPNKIAIEFKSGSLTYKELNAEANRLARVLRRTGVEPDSVIALMVEKSLDMVVAIMAILKAGGAFLPIDPQFPASRIDYMLRDSNTKLLLTHSYMKADFLVSFDGEILHLDKDSFIEEEDSNLSYIGTSSNLFDVIYTSGSTGKPKGVMIEHRSVHNFIIGMTEIIPFESDYTIISLTTMSFDIFILETLLPLTRGLKIVLADPRNVHSHIGNNRIDMLQTTPSTMILMLNDAANMEMIAHLRIVMLGGEPFPPALLDKLKKITHARIFNMYGPTETTIWSSVKELTSTNEMTIGHPIANTQFHILDNNGCPPTVGEIGELYISGDGVARGYLNKPDLTGERFITPSFDIKGGKLYRTGDLGRKNDDGEFTFHGRADNQVKIRGFRIELVEIEDQLGKFPGIRECAVIAKANESGAKYLAAYYVSDKPYEASLLIRHLAEFIPEYMIPGFYLQIDTIPRTPNGKLDRRSLPDPDSSRPMLETSYVSPATAIEQKLADIWGQVLGLNLVGIHDNFFELGGNSILLSVMFAEVQKHFYDRLTLPDLFSYSTVAKLAAFISKDTEHSISVQHINGVTFPAAYFSSVSSAGDHPVFSYIMDESIVAALLEFCSLNKYDSIDVFVGTLAFVLAEECAHKNIEIKIIGQDSDYILALQTDFGTLNNMAGVFAHIHRTLRTASKECILQLNGMSRVIHRDGQLFPLIGDCDHIRNIDIRIFGLAIGVKIEGNQWELMLRYDNGRLENQKVKDLFSTYIRALKTITHIYKKG